MPRARRAAIAIVVTFFAVTRSAFAQPTAAPSRVPPKEITHADAVYPADLVDKGVHADVVLIVTIDAEGHVTNVDVETSGGDELDAAASDAMRKWTFSPALVDGKAVASKIRVPFHFAPPEPAPANATQATVQGHVTSQAGTGTPTTGPAPESVEQLPPRKNEGRVHLAPQPASADVEDVTVHGHAEPVTHSASDMTYKPGELRILPKKNATELLTSAAPGILLTNEGGEGHAEQIFIRGFDASEGQDIEFSVGGVPINESGNLHGNGYADTHFIIPELVERLRVVEGPFDPHQGNYAVAGSADYELGLEKRGLTAKYTFGSWNTQRMLLTWGPKGESIDTFAGAEIQHTDGYGQNRDADRASAMGQYAGTLGKRGIWHVSAQAYATKFHTPGEVREDDYEAGRIGFYDSYDLTSYAHEAVRQGGSASRFSIAGDVSTKTGDTTLKQQVFLIGRQLRLLENFTGFTLDDQTPQRGDELDLHSDEATIGARGSARWETRALGQKQELEIGYFARGDKVHGMQQRLAAATGLPYKTDANLDSDLGDLGLYGDTDLRATKWLSLRGGLRADLLTFDVLDETKSVRSDASATAVMPRGTVLVGPFEKFTFSASYGSGVRSIDPIYVTQDAQTPFASIDSYEGGVVYTGGIGNATLVARSVFFDTHVDKDLVFSENEGRNVLGVGTTRTGWIGSTRITGSFWDENASLTLVKSTFDDNHEPVSYVPGKLFRSDTAFFADLPMRLQGRRIRGTIGAGVTYVAPRPLPNGATSDSIFTIDAAGSLSWTRYELSLSATNLLDTKYRLGEFNDVSDYRSQSQPTTTPARAFIAGPPLGVFASLAVNFGGS